MATFSGDIYSQSLKMMTQINVILPQDMNPSRDLKCLYLLHGLSDNASAWIRRTRIDEYATQRGYIVIMPEVARSFYKDMTFGGNYFTYIAEELPKLCKELFNITVGPEKTFVAGLSMGGYGALKCGLLRPSNYKAVAGFSSACDIKRLVEDVSKKGKDSDEYNDLIGILGNELDVSLEDDLFKFVSESANALDYKDKYFMLTCGKEDFLYQDNVNFYKLLEEKGFNIAYEEWTGDHNWEFWEASIQKALDHFDCLLTK